MKKPAALSSFAQASAVGLLTIGLLAPAHAQLFGGDDQARRAIIELRERVETNHNRLNADIKALAEEVVPLRRGVLELANQVDGLRRELAELRGHNERLAHELASTRQQMAALERRMAGLEQGMVGLEQRIKPLEPVQVSLDGVAFTARAEEVQAFELAMNAIRASDFAGAARLFQALIAQFPHSGYVPSGLYWQGNAYYADRQYTQAIASYQQLVQSAPQHTRAPEALLAIANCHQELRDARAARAALEQLVRAYPQSEVAATARERLARMRR